MAYKIYIIEDAEQDIIQIYNYVLSTESIPKAKNIIKEIEENCNSLKTLPKRGHYPPELEQFGIHEYREIHFKHFRIIYRIIDSNVYIHSILDGRRELQELLESRLLKA
jgi:toxin ParE1/3/4